ncbi:translation initiation factor 4B [Ascosphaera apis ARSEF 7405]|uniref:Translation initiation factor 4B n=1 Tax=Ascosphaera apis ARSEF 7405 TaxID=392613 RepID=A0A168DKL4_9EURO|nr:translation initiation factor 4B [Ascosphaera apis ARSEF 7405]
MAPKQKVQKMALGDFLQDQEFGSWADEMDELPMPPSEPPRMYDGQRRAFGTSSFEDRGYPPRESLPLPTAPPYTAHIGNLSFESTSTDVEAFFADCGTTSVRVVDDRLTGSSKGFGYVEFQDLEGLKKALTLSGTSLQGRAIRVSVAEPRTSNPSYSSSSSSSRYPRYNSLSSGRFDTGNDHGDLGLIRGTYREPGSLSPRLLNHQQPCTLPIPISRSEFGLKLTTLPKFTAKDREPVREFDWTRKGPLPDAPRDNTRDSAPRRRYEPLDPAMGAGAGPSAREFSWERKGPLSPASPPAGGFREGGRPRNVDGPGFRRQSPGASAAMWGEARSRDTSRPAAPPPQPTAAEMDNKWRARMMPDAAPAAAEAAAPTTSVRPKLNLQKRTVPVSEAAAPASAASSDSKANPFGAAKPIDTAAREREIEEKRQAALQAKKEAEEKAKEEREKAKAAAAEAAAAKKEAEEAAAAKKEAEEAAAAAAAAAKEEAANKAEENATEGEKKEETATEEKPAEETKEEAAPAAASASTDATPETTSKPAEEAKPETTTTTTTTLNQQQPPKPAAAENWRTGPRAGGDSHRGGRGGRGGRGAHRGDRHHGGRRHEGENREPREPREPRAQAPPAQPVVDEDGWSTVGPAKKGNRRGRWGHQQQ